MYLHAVFVFHDAIMLTIRLCFGAIEIRHMFFFSSREIRRQGYWQDRLSDGHGPLNGSCSVARLRQAAVFSTACLRPINLGL